MEIANISSADIVAAYHVAAPRAMLSADSSRDDHLAASHVVLGCAFRPVFRFIPVLIFRNSGCSAEVPDSGGTHIGIKSFQGKTGQD